MEVPNKILSRMIFLVATPYSGSTLFALLLNLHPEIVSTGEINGLGYPLSADNYHCSCGEMLNNCPFWLEVEHQMKKRGFSNFSLDHFDTDFNFEANLWMARVSNVLLPTLLNDWRRNLLDMIPGRIARIRHIMARNIALADIILSITNSQYFFDTTKQPIRVEYFTRYNTHNFRVIHLVRDVPGWAASLLKHGRTTSIDKIARHWNAIHQHSTQLLERLPSQNTLVVHYHEVVGQPLETLNQISDFIGLNEFPYSSRAAFDTALNNYDQSHHIIGNVSRKQARKGVPFVLKEDMSWKEVLTETQVKILLNRTAKVRHLLGFDNI